MAEYSLNDIMNMNDVTRSDGKPRLNLYTGFLDEYFNNHIVDVMFDKDTSFTQVTLSDTDKVDYALNPKLLSYKLYGTPDLGPLLLTINHMKHPAEFDCIDSRLNVFLQTDIDSLLEIYEKLK